MIKSNIPPGNTSELIRCQLLRDMSATKIKTVEYKLLGGVGLLALTGIGVSASIWGYSALDTNNTAAARIAQSITTALTTAEIKATAEGTVTLDPAATIKLDSDAEVSLKPHQTVTIAPNSKVIVALPTSSSAFVPNRQQLQENDGEGIERITTTFTIFKTLPYRSGSVVTNWEFKTDQPNVPFSQSCSYKERTDSSAESKVMIAVNGIVQPQVPNRLHINFKDASRNCIWNNV